MTEINEQLLYIKFSLELGQNATETYKMIKIDFWDNSLSFIKTFERFKRFKDG